MFGELIAGFVWVLANIAYLDMKRKGRRGFSRFCAFWLGMPTTFLMLLVVKEDLHREFPLSHDDADALLDEIRRDRALTGGNENSSQEESWEE
jgi:hypothetical protein